MQLARKNLTLPSGAKTVIRKLAPMDFAILGRFPSTTEVQEVKEGESKDFSTQQRQYLIDLQKLCLFNATGKIIGKDGRTYRLVDKPFDELERHKTHTEICAADLEQDDCDMICREVMALSGFESEVAAQAASFPEEQGVSGNSP